MLAIFESSTRNVWRTDGRAGWRAGRARPAGRNACDEYSKAKEMLAILEIARKVVNTK